jgi:ubiquinone/menaquinone biosynthesis C-methylase UbiE
VGEKIHRKYKREKEISLIIERISNIKKFTNLERKDVNILEFGSGDGFQIPYLRKIGTPIASDIYTSVDIRKMKDVVFYECSITNTPFRDSQFDIIFSNHVIEHIENKQDAFKELKRIGTKDCIYAFSVPTPIWLLLSIPAQYYNKFKKILKPLYIFCKSKSDVHLEEENGVNSNFTDKMKTKRFFSQIFPCGHGVYEKFVECYRSFKLKEWQRLFNDNGFYIEKIHPLLLYAPSELPIVPTTAFLNKHNIYSSVLFLLTKESY